MIKNIFFDFNGTLIDDVDLCLELLNKILEKQNKELCSLEKYKNIFGFPIIEYYKRAGVDFNIESYESLAIKFIAEYQPRSLKCGLYKDVYYTLEKLNELGINCYILSASEKNNLLEQCRAYNIDKYFKGILGIDNIHAKSKLDIALDFINKSKINKDETIFIGDTLHDFEVANGMGVATRLVSCGHQSKEVLMTAGVPIYEKISDCLKEIL